MFSISVRSLDGSCRQIGVEPDTTLANIQAQLEERLPPFHEARLVELQFVAMQSPAKALMELQRLAFGADPEVRLPRASLQFAGAVYMTCLPREAPECQGIVAVTEALGEMQELPPDVGEQLLQLLATDFFQTIHASGVEPRTNTQMWDVVTPLVFTFGRKCGDPSPYVATLVAWLGDSMGFKRYAVAERIGDAMPGDLHKALMRWASEEVTYVTEEDGVTGNDLTCACCLLGLLWGDECTDLLQNVINRCPLPQCKEAAAKALDLICSRSLRKVHCAAVASSHEPGYEEDIRVDGNTIAVARHGSDIETDPQLDAVFSESEREVLLQHQQHLQETLLRSKADCATYIGPVEHASCTTAPEDRLVLLCFNRRPKELFEALLASPLAARVMAAGGEPHPKWAGGKLILAEGVTEDSISEAREAWHVAVRASDEGELDTTLRSIFGRERPRVKVTDGRILVPQGSSLFQLSNCSSTGDVYSDGPGFAGDWADVTWNTFIHFPSKVATIPRVSFSAPAEL